MANEREQAFSEAVDAWRAVVNADAGANEGDPNYMSHGEAIWFLAEEMLVTMGLMLPRRGSDEE